MTIYTEKNPKDLTDRELIDEYIGLEGALESADQSDCGMARWDSINAEIKHRGITNEQIEKRRKELYKIWGIEETNKQKRNTDHDLTWEEYKQKHYKIKEKPKMTEDELRCPECGSKNVKSYCDDAFASFECLDCGWEHSVCS